MLQGSVPRPRVLGNSLRCLNTHFSQDMNYCLRPSTTQCSGHTWLDPVDVQNARAGLMQRLVQEVCKQHCATAMSSWQSGAHIQLVPEDFVPPLPPQAPFVSHCAALPHPALAAQREHLGQVKVSALHLSRIDRILRSALATSAAEVFIIPNRRKSLKDQFQAARLLMKAEAHQTASEPEIGPLDLCTLHRVMATSHFVRCCTLGLHIEL